MKYQKIFSPKKIGAIEIRNRVVMTAMGVDVSDHDGTASADTVAYYAERAKGGVGLIITEYTRVNEDDAVTAPGQLSMSSDCYIKPFTDVVNAVHKAGAKIFVQLHHPGRQNIVLFPTYWQMNERLAKVVPGYWKLFFNIVGKYTKDDMNEPKMIRRMEKSMKPLRAPSNVPAGLGLSPFGNEKILPFTADEIHTLVAQFVAAAARVKASGADGVELHAGHGYLLQQFLSPYTNLRTDEYGGSTDHRLRILKEIIEGVKARCGADFPVSVRLSVDECYEKLGYAEMGIKLPEGVKIAKALERFGADLLNVTLGNSDTHFVIEEPMSFPQGWRSDYIRAVKDAVSIPVLAANAIRTPDVAEKLLADGVQDFIGLARPLLADPAWANKARNGEEADICRCMGCLACMEAYEANMMKGLPVTCAMNPRTCRETKISICGTKDGGGRQIVIVGAGPAGLTAARELAMREFKVTVLEKESVPGGQLNLAKLPPHRERLAWCIEDLEQEAKQAGAEIRCSTPATAEFVSNYHPYAVLVASGSSPLVPRIPGADSDYVTTVEPVLKGGVHYQGKTVAVIGSGMTGLETAEMLQAQGNKVIIIEMADKIAPGAYGINAWDILDRLDESDVRYLPGRKLESVLDHKLTLVQKNGVREIIFADAVVLSLGVRGNQKIAEELAGCCDTVIPVGDVCRAGMAAAAIHRAFDVARNLK